MRWFPGMRLTGIAIAMRPGPLILPVRDVTQGGLIINPLLFALRSLLGFPDLDGQRFLARKTRPGEWIDGLAVAGR